MASVCLRKEIIFLRRESLAGAEVSLHLWSTVPIQRMASMKPVDRCAEKRIDSLGSKTMAGTPRCPESFRESTRRADLNLPFLRRFRQIIRSEAKFFAQFSVKIFESGSQFGFDSFACLRFLQLCKT